MNPREFETRRRDLLVRRALEGLDRDEFAELRRVDPRGDFETPDPFELAAAAAHLALLGETWVALPNRLRRRIESDGCRIVDRMIEDGI